MPVLQFMLGSRFGAVLLSVYSKEDNNLCCDIIFPLVIHGILN